MSVELAALVLSGIAVAVSFLLPMHFNRKAERKALEERRSTLLQKILATKSIVFGLRLNIMDYMNRYRARMEKDQISGLENACEKLKADEGNLWALHAECRRRSREDAEDDLADIFENVAVMESEAADIVALVDAGRKSYE